MPTQIPPPAARVATFAATIPPTESALRIHGEEGARLLLDIAESDLPAFLMVLPMRGSRLRVTIEDTRSIA